MRRTALRLFFVVTQDLQHNVTFFQQAQSGTNDFVFGTVTPGFNLAFKKLFKMYSQCGTGIFSFDQEYESDNRPPIMGDDTDGDIKQLIIEAPYRVRVCEYGLQTVCVVKPVRPRHDSGGLLYAKPACPDGTCHGLP